MKITKKQARQFILAHQNLLPPRRLVGKEAIISYIQKVGCIQFDPLNKVGKNTDLVLQSRVKDYQRNILEELLYEDRQLLDGWDKNMSVYPIADWPYFTRYREEAKQRFGSEEQSFHQILPEVRKKISEKGPLSSLELNFNDKVDWAWAPTRMARAALESMYYWGEIIVHHRVGTRRIYDFATNYIPEELLNCSDPNTTIEEYIDWHIKRRIGSIGLVWGRSSGAWLGIHWMKSKDRTQAIERLLKSDSIKSIHVEEINEPLFIRSEDMPLLEKVLTEIDYQSEASFIAPLDNLLWDRNLIRELFDFDYIWEVYKPIKEREYGYYVLPVLYGDRFVARFEPVYNRKTETLEIINWWWEQDHQSNSEEDKALIACMNDFKEYLGAKKLKLHRRAKKALTFLQ